MTELILSDITRMKSGYCVIGLQAAGSGFRSVRPMPPRGHAWPAHWRHTRGERLRFRLQTVPQMMPHVEDQLSAGEPECPGRISEQELVRCLRGAETAGSRDELFGCMLQRSAMGGSAAWVKPEEAKRSICGCEIRSVRFRWKIDRWRAEVRMAAGEILESLPIVDHDWNNFLEAAAARAGGPNAVERVQSFLNGFVARTIWNDEQPFARIGLARPNPQGGCWLMLDSLFPLPKGEWLEEFAGRPEVK